MLPTSLDHHQCLDTLSNYGPGRESCMDKVFSPRLGVLSGFVFFNAVHRGTLPLASPGKLDGFFKVGTYYYNWSTMVEEEEEEEEEEEFHSQLKLRTRRPRATRAPTHLIASSF